MTARRIDPARDLARVARLVDTARRTFDDGRPGDALRLADEATQALARATADVAAWRDGMTLDEVADLHGVPLSAVRAALGTGLDVVALRGHGRVVETSAVAWRPAREWPRHLDDRALAVAAYVEHLGSACRSDVVAAFGCLPNAATDALRAAVDAGLLHRNGPRYTPTATSTSAAA